MTPERPMGADAFPTSDVPPSVEPFSTQTTDPALLYAALDLGTNSCRMLIAQPRGSQFQVIDSFSKTVQLGRRARGLGQAQPRLDGADGAGAADLPEEDRETSGEADAAGGDRSLPAGPQCARFHPQRRAARPGCGWRSSRRKKRRASRWCPARRWSASAPSNCWWWISAAGRPSWSGSTCRGCRMRIARAPSCGCMRGFTSLTVASRGAGGGLDLGAAGRCHAEGPVQRCRG